MNLKQIAVCRFCSRDTYETSKINRGNEYLVKDGGIFISERVSNNNNNSTFRKLKHAHNCFVPRYREIQKESLHETRSTILRETRIKRP